MNMLRDRDLFGFGLCLLGLSLAASPWLLGYHHEFTAAASAAGLGSLFFLIGAASLLCLRGWPEAGALTAGAWTLVAPMLLGFIGNGAAAAAHAATGVASLTLLAASVDWRQKGPPEIPV